MAERFREFELDRSKRRLLCRGDPVEIGQLTLDLLMYLIDHRDRVIPRRELQSAVWRGRKVSPSTIPTAINVLRNTFRDSARESEVIRTVYGRGYQWIAGVEEAEASNVRDARGRARHFFGRRV